MPDVASTWPSSNRPSDRSSSATGGGVVRNGSVGVSPKAPDIAARNGPHSSGVAGRSRESRSSATGGCLPAGSDVRPPSSSPPRGWPRDAGLELGRDADLDGGAARPDDRKGRRDLA